MLLKGNTSLKDRSKKSPPSKELLFKSPSPLTAKSVLFAIGLFVGSSCAMLTHPAQNSTMSWFQNHIPTIMSITGCYIGGFFVGWWIRNLLKLTSILIGIILALIGFFITYGWDSSIFESWGNSIGGWLNDNIAVARYYFISLLPSITAAGVGVVLGFRRL
jgi:uncharacterized membrane protein (Fun14 family)